MSGFCPANAFKITDGPCNYQIRAYDGNGFNGGFVLLVGAIYV